MQRCWGPCLNDVCLHQGGRHNLSMKLATVVKGARRRDSRNLSESYLQTWVPFRSIVIFTAECKLLVRAKYFSAPNNLSQQKTLKCEMSGECEMTKPCPICGALLSKGHNLRRHMAAHSGKKKPHKCDFCEWGEYNFQPSRTEVG